MNRYLKRAVVGITAGLLVCSVAGNIYMMSGPETAGDDEIWNISFPDTNTRDTYVSIHNLKEAQKAGTGKGVRVGILDWCFGFEEQEGLYAGGRDFSDFEYHEDSFRHNSEHGFWMAQTLREIAPDVEIYALGTFDPDSEDKWVDNMIEAIGWALENDIDILTLSHQEISRRNRGRFDEAVNNAVKQGIVTTFIHYDNPNNILPWGIWSGDAGYGRQPDINIFQYDYNTLFLQSYEEALGDRDFTSGYKSELFLSISSMSVVTAGFVAILKSVDDTLTPAQYKEILVKTSHPGEYENDSAEHVADIGEAVRYVKAGY